MGGLGMEQEENEISNTTLSSVAIESQNTSLQTTKSPLLRSILIGNEYSKKLCFKIFWLFCFTF